MKPFQISLLNFSLAVTSVAVICGLAQLYPDYGYSGLSDEIRNAPIEGALSGTVICAIFVIVGAAANRIRQFLYIGIGIGAIAAVSWVVARLIFLGQIANSV